MILNAAYSFMDNYSQHAGLSILSLFVNNTDIDEINVYIIDNEISKKNTDNFLSIAKKYNRKIIFISLDSISSKMDVDTNFCRSTYGKLFLSQIEEVDRMLTFDCDTIITGSLKDLLDYDMSDTLLAGVQDTINPYFVHKIGLTNKDRYINCGGVIVLNLKLWRQRNIEQKCIDYVLKYDGNPPFVDQGTVNYICRNNKKVLPPNYNVINPMFMFPVKKIKSLFKMETYYSQAEIEEAITNPIVIHFTGELFNRPWFESCTHPLKDEYLKYLDQSPWAGVLPDKKLSKNGRIQHWIYYKCPFFIYKLMIRFIELRHRLTTRVM